MSRDGMGMPHLFARYRSGDAHELEPGARCAACGAPAEHCHHMPPKGIGGGSATQTVRIADGSEHVLRPALIALCGKCHEAYHATGRLGIEWVWDLPQHGWDWNDGMLAAPVYDGNSPLLWRWGQWVFRTERGDTAVRLDMDGNVARRRL